MANTLIIPQKAKKSKSTPGQKLPQPHTPHWLQITGRVLLTLIWVTLVFFACQIAVAFVMRLILGDALLQPVWVTVCSALTYILMLFIVIFVPHFIKPQWHVNRTLLGFRQPLTWTGIGLALVGLVVYFVVAALLVSLLTAVCPWFDPTQAQNVGYNVLYNIPDRIFAFTALVIIAPIAEETIFRGWLYGKLRAIIPGKASLPIAMLLVSLLFGVLHGQWNVGVNVFVLSLVLCGLREITGTIHSGILVHMIKNGIAFYLLFILGTGM